MLHFYALVNGHMELLSTRAWIARNDFFTSTSFTMSCVYYVSLPTGDFLPSPSFLPPSLLASAKSFFFYFSQTLFTRLPLYCDNSWNSSSLSPLMHSLLRWASMNHRLTCCLHSSPSCYLSLDQCELLPSSLTYFIVTRDASLRIISFSLSLSCLLDSSIFFIQINLMIQPLFSLVSLFSSFFSLSLLLSPPLVYRSTFTLSYSRAILQNLWVLVTFTFSFLPSSLPSFLSPSYTLVLFTQCTMFT